MEISGSPFQSLCTAIDPTRNWLCYKWRLLDGLVELTNRSGFGSSGAFEVQS